MGPLIGFVSIPRPAEPLRPAGAFFSAVVDSQAGPHTWRVRIEGRVTLVTTDLSLVPGQVLRLKLASQEQGRWLFQLIPPAVQTGPGGPVADPGLMAAFLSRGLPLAAERLSVWSRWLGRVPGAADKEGWAASLEARGEQPAGAMAEALEPWLAWQSSLEDGRTRQPPEDDGFWDLWNSRQTPAGDPWLVMPLRWEYQGQADAGLLQAHWSPQAQAVDRWHLTASPAGTAFRLEAQAKPRRLELVWRFFHEDDRLRWKPLVPGLAAACSGSDLQVVLDVQGPPHNAVRLPEGIDVQA